MNRFSVDGWYAGATRYDSPNCDARPDGTAVELLVLHNASLPLGRFGTPHMLDLFTNRVDYTADPSFASLRGLEVSAHFMIRRDGRVIQFVSTERRAWHAGVSEFEGRANCNAFSVGVELEGTDFEPFTAAQYAALVPLTQALLLRYPIRAIVGHEHVAPGRKTDPGPHFDWSGYADLLVRQHEKATPLVAAYRALRIVTGLVKVKMPG